jgi:hypothetical protein
MKKVKVFEEFINETEEVNEGVVSIKGGRIIARKVIEKLVEMDIISEKKNNDSLVESIAKVITDAKMESIGSMDESTEVNEGGSLSVNKEKDGLYYWTFTFASSGKTQKSSSGFKTSADAQKDFMYKSKYFKESLVNEKKIEIEVSLRHAREAGELFDDMFKSFGKKEHSNTFIFKDEDGAHDFVTMLVNRMQIPVGEITMPEGLL